jgi:uncharacterized protein YkwD
MPRTPIIALRVLALAALFCFASLAPASASAASYEHDVVVKTNAYRHNKGLVDVHTKSCVDGYAERWGEHLAKTQELVHQDLKPILKKCHLSSVSENIAYGYSSGKSVVRAWMNSDGHRKNILTKGMRQIGVGAYKDSDGRWWVSQVFGRS